MMSKNDHSTTHLRSHRFSIGGSDRALPGTKKLREPNFSFLNAPLNKIESSRKLLGRLPKIGAHKGVLASSADES